VAGKSSKGMTWALVPEGVSKPLLELSLRFFFMSTVFQLQYQTLSFFFLEGGFSGCGDVSGRDLL
jgi:hypothetical protein